MTSAPDDASPRPRRPHPYAHAPRLPEGEISLPSLVPEGGPLALEIGPGRGAFALAWLAHDPRVRLVALEVRLKWAAVLDAQMRARGYGGRGRCFAEDARAALPRLGPDGSVDVVFLHFPDPWWKKRHHKRLVLGDALAAEAARLLAPGGVFYLQTDVEERAELYERVVGACPALEPAGEGGSARLGQNPYGVRSNREVRADEDGLPVYRMRFRKRAG
ncbi:MAG TPA: tRNA (guanine-N7)-methyltransferase [Polyangiaceae bacterium]|nr:tRNA (guanine-N7)-methyltransferase [Polyangiaceae bacterium]